MPRMRGSRSIDTLSAGSREEVDDLAGRALAAGGGEPLEHSVMHRRAFVDPEGHRRAAVRMDVEAAMAAGDAVDACGGSA